MKRGSVTLGFDMPLRIDNATIGPEGALFFHRRIQPNGPVMDGFPITHVASYLRVVPFESQSAAKLSLEQAVV